MTLPNYSGPWNISTARKLAARAGFGGTPSEIDALVAMGMDAAVNSFANYDGAQELARLNAALEADASGFVSDIPQIRESARVSNDHALKVFGWWFYLMLNTRFPLWAQIALFLQDHMPTDSKTLYKGINTTVARAALGSNGEHTVVARLMVAKLKLFMTSGQTDFRGLALAITRDPSMLIYLDNFVNVKGAAQENYARELMELFTIGAEMSSWAIDGTYSEQDVREAARALTGETVDLTHVSHRRIFNAAQHDAGSKTIFGQTVQPAMDGTETVQLINLCLDRQSRVGLPLTALHMAWKLIRWFADEDCPQDSPRVADLAEVFASTWSIKETVRHLLKSEYFYAAPPMHKNPVDFVLTALRNIRPSRFDAEFSMATALPKNFMAMGMQFAEAPKVFGWDHGANWRSGATMIAETTFAGQLGTYYRHNPALSAIQGATGGTHGSMVQYFADRLGLSPLSPGESGLLVKYLDMLAGASFANKLAGLTQAITSIARYRLK